MIRALSTRRASWQSTDNSALPPEPQRSSAHRHGTVAEAKAQDSRRGMLVTAKVWKIISFRDGTHEDEPWPRPKGRGPPYY